MQRLQNYKEAIMYIFFMVVIISFVVVKMQPKVVELINTEKSISEKTLEAEDKERKLESLKATALQKDARLAGQNKKIYKPSEAGLDAESSFTIVFDDIIEIAKYNGIRIFSIEYVYNPPTDDFIKGAADKYNVCELSMQLIGDYADMESFFRDIYKYPYLINIEKLELTPYTKNKKMLIINLQLKLYSEK